jgi:hypothetical protein
VLALIQRIVKVGVLIFGVVTALGTAGINVSALVAGLGLTGFALGFALKGIVLWLIIRLTSAQRAQNFTSSRLVTSWPPKNERWGASRP